MKPIGKDGAKIIINIDKAYNVNPAATVVNNTFNISLGREAADAVKEALGGGNKKSVSLFDCMREPEETIDCTHIRTEILSYVSRVRPLLTDEAKSSFMKIWEDILELPEVASKVYKPGKQWGTNFHRDLVANILYHLRTRKIYKVVYKDNYNGAAMCEALEGNRDHSVKHALRDNPPADVREAVDKLLKEKY
jgi:hypothetical protein